MFAREQIGRSLLLLTAALLLAGCGGGSGDGTSAGAGSEVVYPGAVSLVDGRVGDSPFADDGGGTGLADGRSLLGSSGTAVRIAWDPVALQVDGMGPASVAGYRIYGGHKPGNYEWVVELGDPSASSHALAGLPSGTYYFAVSAVDLLNREGPLSNVTSVSLP